MPTFTKAILSKEIVAITSSLVRPSNATQYTIDDAVSAVTTDAHLTFSGVANAGKMTATIESATASSSVDHGTVLPDLQLVLFRKDFIAIADNAAATISDAEALTVIGVVDFPVANWVGLTASAVCSIDNIGLDIKTGQDGANSNVEIYGQLIIKNTYTPASAEVFSVELVINRH